MFGVEVVYRAMHIIPWSESSIKYYNSKWIIKYHRKEENIDCDLISQGLKVCME